MSSINKKELKKFEKISHNWWNKDGEFGILHRINHIRIEYIIEKIKLHYNDISKLQILDVGCGGGLIAAPLASQGFNVTAIDALKSNIETATIYAQKNDLKINYLQTTIEELENDKLYDVVICLEVIEHVENVQQFILNLVQHIKPNGIAIISTINRTKKAYLFGIIVAEYILGWVPKNTHDYSKFLKPSEIYEILTDTNIEIKELKGLVFNLARNEWKLSNDIDVNYFMYLGKKINSLSNAINSIP
ncbi:bifunctional 2-polyprenyl-6-hydroxyphenol methylase/3-demethylubiquinol 3-O-methyltransferase UbiG [Rickettsia typhi]|uniref:Ubiquinone biosynthesis O-methyltransferase n=2 Tax=Rickettsia typhi TaxID=785 RepID=UBIG_RICTY|nr:bifunctional 2-polyprenyl-6-hydroxyphenol methylase/3-demethylubiquinol 3-O-methyltransferase UbiG [Rickettsia typhi]Q68WB5.1 RecName: Full=Ubiquinone biosynthesis O-methyltransferase; AltName: Full=2-polyprenyl-6-hydroxyphenol methylase; AltName: Full=3-demethylubiquinone 3-O-methyltransferase [Rickettsia typhi str. Wilmington]AAU04077.1 3-demethylubiquinone-9 3-O-methyltransferase [Rickettsia typhi str. Wilmington]AFE54455.1 bifunctional 3-demethylubiquinone-9 3-methyltransferase/ 2-octapre